MSRLFAQLERHHYKTAGLSSISECLQLVFLELVFLFLRVTNIIYGL